MHPGIPNPFCALDGTFFLFQMEQWPCIANDNAIHFFGPFFCFTAQAISFN